MAEADINVWEKAQRRHLGLKSSKECVAVDWDRTCGEGLLLKDLRLRGGRRIVPKPKGAHYKTAAKRQLQAERLAAHAIGRGFRLMIGKGDDAEIPDASPRSIWTRFLLDKSELSFDEGQIPFTVATLSNASQAHAMSEKSQTHAMSEKSQTHAMSEKSQTHAISEKSQTHAMSEKSETHAISFFGAVLDLEVNSMPTLCGDLRTITLAKNLVSVAVRGTYFWDTKWKDVNFARLGPPVIVGDVPTQDDSAGNNTAGDEIAAAPPGGRRRRRRRRAGEREALNPAVSDVAPVVSYVDVVRGRGGVQKDGHIFRSAEQPLKVNVAAAAARGPRKIPQEMSEGSMDEDSACADRQTPESVNDHSTAASCSPVASRRGVDAQLASSRTRPRRLLGGSGGGGGSGTGSGGGGESAVRDGCRAAPLLFTVNPYVGNQVIDEVLNNKVRELLQTLNRLQQRQRDAAMATGNVSGKRIRYVCGVKEVMRLLRSPLDRFEAMNGPLAARRRPQELEDGKHPATDTGDTDTAGEMRVLVVDSEACEDPEGVVGESTSSRGDRRKGNRRAAVRRREACRSVHVQDLFDADAFHQITPADVVPSRLKCVIIPPNLEISPLGQRGMIGAVDQIKSESELLSVPVVFALSRNLLGRACGKAVRQSAVGIVNADGAHAVLKEVLQLAERRRVRVNVIE